ncbi:MAG: hypothetical protein AAB658_18825, partial [Chloroflexota bacterium]
MPKTSPTKIDKVKEVDVPQGWEVFLWGIFGSLLGIAPATMLLPGIPALSMPWKVLIPVCWACFAGWPVTYYWSQALHKRIALLKVQLNSIG